MISRFVCEMLVQAVYAQICLCGLLMTPSDFKANIYSIKLIVFVLPL